MRSHSAGVLTITAGEADMGRVGQRPAVCPPGPSLPCPGEVRTDGSTSGRVIRRIVHHFGEARTSSCIL